LARARRGEVTELIKNTRPRPHSFGR
jgi:hypothetical protein